MLWASVSYGSGFRSEFKMNWVGGADRYFADVTFCLQMATIVNWHFYFIHLFLQLICFYGGGGWQWKSPPHLKMYAPVSSFQGTTFWATSEWFSYYFSATNEQHTTWWWWLFLNSHSISVTCSKNGTKSVCWCALKNLLNWIMGICLWRDDVIFYLLANHAFESSVEFRLKSSPIIFLVYFLWHVCI